MTFDIEAESYARLIEGRDNLILAIRIAERSAEIGDFAFCAYILNLKNSLHYAEQAIASYRFMIDANLMKEEITMK